MRASNGLMTAAVALLGIAGSVGAQEGMMHRWDDLDTARLWLADSTIFVPFQVTGTVPLKQALDDGTLDPDTKLVILERGGNRLALVLVQIAYHHVAQGDLMGEPWMVSF
jgi:hypothetical protein